MKFKLLYKTSVLIFAAVIISGCVSAPQPVGDFSFQKKLQSARHWHILAQDAAEQIQSILNASNMQKQAMYVTPSSDTSFGQGFHNMLVTSLVDRGVKSLTQPDKSALKITYEAQVVHHLANRNRLPKTGLLALLAGEIAVFRNIKIHNTTHPVAQTAIGAGALAGGAMVYDFLNEDIPHTEIVLTISISKGNEYFIRKTDCYYINDSDHWHYKPPTPPKPMKVMG
ncbi:MAG: hypothetical protein EPN22_02925 [Nitrospirae bacterium]|nr:MAG: hypothetical protein EPN22_02925 [Nitrospirota bacterium]